MVYDFDRLGVAENSSVFKNKDVIINIICGIILLVLIGLLIYCLTKKDNFMNETVKKNGNISKDDKNVIVFIDNPSCGFSKIMKKVLEENNMKIGDKNVITKNIMTDGKDLAKQYGITGTPGFINEMNGKTHMGLEKNLDVLKISFDDDDDDHDDVTKSVNIIVGRPSCPYCLKLNKLLEQNNIQHEKVDSNSQEGVDLMKKVNANGVPISIKMNNDNIEKFKVGYHEDMDFYT
jgi:glutaredoxin